MHLYKKYKKMGCQVPDKHWHLISLANMNHERVAIAGFYGSIEHKLYKGSRFSTRWADYAVENSIDDIN